MTGEIQEIVIHTEDIRLDQFLKWAQVVDTGGKAKELIRSEQVKVNGVVETRRTHRLRHGDLVEVENLGQYKVIHSSSR